MARATYRGGSPVELRFRDGITRHRPSAALCRLRGSLGPSSLGVREKYRCARKHLIGRFNPNCVSFVRLTGREHTCFGN